MINVIIYFKNNNENASSVITNVENVCYENGQVIITKKSNNRSLTYTYNMKEIDRIKYDDIKEET